MTNTILIVEDEQEIADLLGIVLHREGFDHVFRAASVASALETARRVEPDLVVLDVMLPDGSGFDVAARLRGFTQAPIIFLTARDGDADKLMGFGVGADDYVTKPFNPLEVVARIKAQLRRSRNEAEPHESYDLGRVRVEPDAGRVLVDGAEVPMPAREFKLLCYLAANPGHVFSARQLYREVWGEEPVGPSDDNTVTVHVRRIRERVETDPASPQLLMTVRGLGYKLVAPSCVERS